MKTWKDVTYDRLLDEELIDYCWAQASKGKRKRKSVQNMKTKKEQLKLLSELKEGVYKPQACRKMSKWDKNAKKTRDISCPAFRDQIVHWMIVTLIRPHFEATFIQHNVANVPNRGLSYGNLLIKHWSQQKGTKYVLKLDIKKYYPSINIPMLIKKLEVKIRDKRLIKLIETILYKESPNGIGLSLGSYLNLWLALFNLDELDHIMKEQFKVKFYLRYVDDILILTKTKKEAKKLLKFIIGYLGNIGLTVKTEGRGKAKIYKWDKDKFIDMLGTKTYRNKQILRGTVYLNINRQVNKAEKKGKAPHLARSVLSYKGIVQYSDCSLLYNKINKTIEKLKLKEVAGL
jgi:hypothetical protein